MRSVHLSGIGMLPVVRGTEATECELATAALARARADAGGASPTAIYVGTMLAGVGGAQRMLATAVADAAGLVGVEAMTVEAACASGAAALRAAVLAVASGAHEVVAAVGVERMTRLEKRELSRELATASHWPTEGSRGETFLSLNAQLTRRYLAEHRLDDDALAPFPLLARANAAEATHALYREPIDRDDYRRARPVEDGLRLLDVAPVCDGAAAIVLSAHPTTQQGERVRIVGSSVATDALALASRSDPLALSAVARSAELAFRMAGCSRDDVDVFEPHDAYSVLAALSLEAIGFAPRGQAPARASEGCFGRDGRLRILTRGGLESRGHPIGATGIYQVAELGQLLRGPAEPGVRTPRVGMAQSFGGAASTVFTHLLERTG